MPRSKRERHSGRRPAVPGMIATQHSDPSGQVVLTQEQTQAVMNTMREHGLVPVHIAAICLLLMAIVGGEEAARKELRRLADAIKIPDHLRDGLVEAVYGASAAGPRAPK